MTDTQPFGHPVCLLLHGDERKALGGPSVRVPRTAAALRALGVSARATHFDGQAEAIEEDVVHLFNVWPPDSALHALHSLKQAGKTVIFSPIYLDLRARDFWQKELPKLAATDATELRARYGAYLAHEAVRGRWSEIVPGYHAMLREMLDIADHVIFLSAAERDALEQIGVRVDPARSSLIANPVDVDRWTGGDAALFHKTHLEGLPGPDAYIVCVGRIEERKNQLMLARAVRDLPIRLVLVGHAGSPDYAAQLRRVAGPDVLIVDRVDPGSDMLRSVLAGARAFVLPSWSEGASLAALEAAACTTPLVLSTCSSERAYFGDLAEYCDPADLSSIRAAVQRVLDDDSNEFKARGAALQAHVRVHNSWAGHTTATVAAYEAACAVPRTTVPADALPPCGVQHLVCDVTLGDARRSVHRFTAGLIDALTLADPSVQLIFWHPVLDAFVDVPKRFRTAEQVLEYCRHAHVDTVCAPVDLNPKTAVMTLGQAWCDTPAYLAALEDLRVREGCRVQALVYELGPLRRPYLYDAPVAARFHAGLLRLVGLVDAVIAVSPCTRQTLATALGAVRLSCPDVRSITPAPPKRAQIDPDGAHFSGHLFAQGEFVLATGDVDTLSNHEMLCRIWAHLGAEGLHLVLVCPATAAAAALRDRIARDPQICETVHMVTDLSAQDLAWLYEACTLTVQPSEDTDAIIPVLESLGHGKRCLVSDAVSVPQGAVAHVTRIDPSDRAGWIAAICARDAQGVAPLALSMAETADALRTQACAPGPVRAFRRAYAGEVLNAGAFAPPLSIRFGVGWHRAHDGCRWASAPAASLSLWSRCAQGTTLRVLLRLCARIAPGSIERFRIVCGGETVFENDVGAQDFPEEVVFTVPPAGRDVQDRIDVHLHLPLWRRTGQVAAPDTGAQDGDALEDTVGAGVGLVAAVVLDAVQTNPLHALTHPHHWSVGEMTLSADMSDAAHRAVIAPGLNASDAWGVGTPAGRVGLRIPVLPGAGAHQLSVTVRPIATPRHPVTAVVAWNGRPLTERTWDSDMPDTLSLPLTAEDLDLCGPAILTVESGSILTPADLGIGTSKGHAGLGVSSIFLTPKGDSR